MTSIATIQFQDRDAQDEAIIVIRADSGVVGLGLSLKSDCDVDVVVPLEKVRVLIRVLQEAAEIAGKPS